MRSLKARIGLRMASASSSRYSHESLGRELSVKPAQYMRAVRDPPGHAGHARAAGRHVPRLNSSSKLCRPFESARATHCRVYALSTSHRAQRLSICRSTTARAGWGRASRPERPRGRRPLQRGGDNAGPASRVGISGRQNTTRPLARFGRAPRGREDEIPDPNRRPLTDHLSRGHGAEHFWSTRRCDQPRSPSPSPSPSTTRSTSRCTSES